MAARDASTDTADPVDAADPVDVAPVDPPVEVVRSARRRKTVQARLVDGVLRVSVPAALSPAEEARWVEEMTRRFRRRTRAERVDLTRRAAVLAGRYDLPRPAEISWVDDQRTRWGSCTPGRGTVRLSTRLAAFPSWVVDYVVVHELAHLAVPDHSPAFHALVDRYPRAERARGFLIAKGLDPDDER